MVSCGWCRATSEMKLRLPNALSACTTMNRWRESSIRLRGHTDCLVYHQTRDRWEITRKPSAPRGSFGLLSQEILVRDGRLFVAQSRNLTSPRPMTTSAPVWWSFCPRDADNALLVWGQFRVFSCKAIRVWRAHGLCLWLLRVLEPTRTSPLHALCRVAVHCDISSSHFRMQLFISGRPKGLPMKVS